MSLEHGEEVIRKKRNLFPEVNPKVGLFRTPVKLTHPVEFPDGNPCSSSARVLLSVHTICQTHLQKLRSGSSFLDTSQLLFPPCVTSLLFLFF